MHMGQRPRQATNAQTPHSCTARTWEAPGTPKYRMAAVAAAAAMLGPSTSAACRLVRPLASDTARPADSEADR